MGKKQNTAAGTQPLSATNTELKLTVVPTKFLNTDEIVALTGTSRATLNRWCKNGSFPAPSKLCAGGLIGWTVAEYEEWVSSRPKVRY